jgi:hypothetical protein
MKLVVMTEAASESGALLKAIVYGETILRNSPVRSASFRISSKSEQELEESGPTPNRSTHCNHPPTATNIIDVVACVDLSQSSSRLAARSGASTRSTASISASALL